MYNVWIIFSVGVIAGIGICVGWSFVESAAIWLSNGIDWLMIKLKGAKDRVKERMKEEPGGGGDE